MIYLYGRCSAEENFNKGSSIETQLLRCRSFVTMKGLGLRRLDSGIVEEIPPHLMQSLFSNTDVLKSLKSSTDCRIILADNGRMWIDGNTDSISDIISRIHKVKKLSRDFSTLDSMVEALQTEVY